MSVYRLFNGENVVLSPPNEKDNKEVIRVATEVGFPIYQGTIDEPWDIQYPYLYCCDSHEWYGNSDISQCVNDDERECKNLQEWVTELYKWKKDKEYKEWHTNYSMA